MNNLRNILKKININRPVLFDEPMSSHTTFRTGGPADAYAVPENTRELILLRNTAHENGLPVFVIGGGANLLVSDKGLRGLVIDTSGMNRISIDGCILTAEAGASVDAAAEAACSAGLTGLDVFFGMPGTIGGAVWMNARCYGTEISDILVYAEYLDDNLDIRKMPTGSGFGYKESPFQDSNFIITGASFRLSPGVPDAIRRNMDEKKADREAKGHYAAPCAGSVFKNNRDFGKPSGMIIDSLGLRGTAAGGAKISENHANIIINSGGAKSSDIAALVRLVEEKVYAQYGFRLEPEIRMLGEF